MDYKFEDFTNILTILEERYLDAEIIWKKLTDGSISITMNYHGKSIKKVIPECCDDESMYVVMDAMYEAVKGGE